MTKSLPVETVNQLFDDSGLGGLLREGLVFSDEADMLLTRIGTHLETLDLAQPVRDLLAGAPWLELRALASQAASKLQGIHRFMPLFEDELFELVFERLDSSTATAVAERLLGKPVQPPSLQDAMSATPLSALRLAPGVELGDLHVRLLHYEEGVYDVEVNFQLRHSSAKSHRDVVAELHRFATELARDKGVESYFAGLEPASDKATRLFTGCEQGPYYVLS